MRPGRETEVLLTVCAPVSGGPTNGAAIGVLAVAGAVSGSGSGRRERAAVTKRAISSRV